jgi:hypothetical protein
MRPGQVVDVALPHGVLPAEPEQQDPQRPHIRMEQRLLLGIPPQAGEVVHQSGGGLGQRQREPAVAPHASQDRRPVAAQCEQRLPARRRIPTEPVQIFPLRRCVEGERPGGAERAQRQVDRQLGGLHHGGCGSVNVQVQMAQAAPALPQRQPLAAAAFAPAPRVAFTPVRAGPAHESHLGGHPRLAVPARARAVRRKRHQVGEVDGAGLVRPRKAQRCRGGLQHP